MIIEKKVRDRYMAGNNIFLIRINQIACNAAMFVVECDRFDSHTTL